MTLLSHASSQQRFSASPDVLGKPVTLNQTSYAIVGVLPPSFHDPTRGHIYAPIGSNIVVMSRVPLLIILADLCWPQALEVGSRVS